MQAGDGAEHDVDDDARGDAVIQRPITLTILRSLERLPDYAPAHSGSFVVEEPDHFWIRLSAEEHAALRAAHQAGRRLVFEIRVAPPTLEALATRDAESQAAQ